MADLGRQVKYGIGIEATPGTAVTPTRWFNQLSFDLHPVTTTANNSSGWANLVRTNSTSVVRRHAEGSVEAKLTPNLGAIVFAATMGVASTATNADASGNVYDHTINISNNIEGKTFTLVRQDGLSTEAYAGCRFGEWQLTLDLDGYVTYTAAVYGRPAASTAATAAFVDEIEFVASHLNVKQAATAAGLGAAANIATVDAFTLTCNPNIEQDNEAGNKAPAGFTSRGYELSFEITKRYTDRTFENAYKNGTATAWQLNIVNDDETIGTSARAGAVFTAPKCNITDWTRDESDLDNPINETFTGTIHYSAADQYALRAVFTNTLTSIF